MTKYYIVIVSRRRKDYWSMYISCVAVLYDIFLRTIYDFRSKKIIAYYSISNLRQRYFRSYTYSNESGGIQRVIWNTTWEIWFRKLYKHQPRWKRHNIIIMPKWYTTCIAVRFRQVQKAICRIFHDVLKLMERLAVEYIRPKQSNNLHLYPTAWKKVQDFGLI